MDLLRLRFDPEDEWHGRLTATVSASRFAGQGSAWFATDELRRFAAAVSVFPLREDDLPRIAGGFWDKTGADVLDQVHLSIELAPHSPRGSIRVTTRLATAVWNTETVDLASNVTARFLVTYGDLGLFASSLFDMIEGRSAEAELQSSAD
jgi:hypothetical protein